MAWFAKNKSTDLPDYNKLVLENVPDPIIVIDNDWKINFINKSAEELFSYKDNELKDAQFNQLVFAGENCPSLNKAKGTLVNGNPWEGDIVLKTKSGKALNESLIFKPVLNGTPEIHGILAQIKNQVHSSPAISAENSTESTTSSVLINELMNSISDGVAIYEAVGDGANFKFIDINEAGLKIGGHNREDLIGEFVSIAYPGAEEMGLLKGLRQVWSSGKPQNIPLTTYNDNRLKLWVENYIFKLPNNNIVAVYKDLTLRKIAEKNLNQTSTRFETIVENVKEIICICDDHGNVKFANTPALEFHKSIGVNLDNANIYTDLPLELSESLIPYFKSGLQSKAASQFDIKFTNNNQRYSLEGWLIPLIENGKIQSIILSIRDISEFAQAQNELVEKEARLNKITSAASDAIIVFNIDFKINFWNQSAENIFGYSQEEILVQKANKLFEASKHSYSLNEVIQKLHEQKGQTAGELRSIEITGIAKNQERKVLEMSVSKTTLSGEGNYVAILRDITQRKKHEKELLNAKKRAEASDQLKSNFLANLSHEIRTPMNAIIGLSDMISDQTIEEDEKDDFIQLIQSNSKQLLKIIEDLIDLSKLSSGDLKLSPADFRINKLIRLCIASVQNNIKIQKGLIELKTNFPANLDPIVHFDDFRLQQIIEHLLDNALKFTHEGNVEVGYKIIKNDKGKDILEVYVSDTGIGIPEDQQESIFNYFQQVDGSNTRTAGGTGVGLAISRGILQLAGERLEVKSKLNIGSRFSLSLADFKLEKTDGNISAPPKQDFPDWSRKHLLIVEDIDSNYLFLLKALQKTGIHISWSQDGLEAIESFKNKSDEIDIVLMDINLPLLNGYESTAEIRKIKPDIPVIAQTAFASKEEEEHCLSSGFSDYISKPIRRKILIEKMKAFLT